VLVPGVELVAQRAGEEPGIALADDDPAADDVEGKVEQGTVPEPDAGDVRAEASEPVGEPAGLLGPARHDRRQQAGLDDHAAALVDENRVAGRQRLSVRRGQVAVVRLDAQDGHDLARPDVGPGEPVEELRGRAQR